MIALHCSGAGSSQWQRLADLLGDGYELRAPEHYGCESAGPWTGEHPFTLADEAARTLALIDGTDRKVHLVGHSYGGGVALHVALARPGRIASLSLYEPSAFHLLRQIGGGAAAFAEIRSVAYAIATGVVVGDYRRAAITFVEYWSGHGAWNALRPAVQAALIAWMPKAPLDFNALFGEPEMPAAYARVDCPVLVMRGERAPAPTQIIAETLPSLMRDAQRQRRCRRGPHGSAHARGSGQCLDCFARRQRGEACPSRRLKPASVESARAPPPAMSAVSCIW